MVEVLLATAPLEQDPAAEGVTQIRETGAWARAATFYARRQNANRWDHGPGFEEGKVLGQTPHGLEPARPVTRVRLGREPSPPQGQLQGQGPTVTGAVRVPSKIEHQTPLFAKNVTERAPVSQISSNASEHFQGALHGRDLGQGMATRRSCRRLTRV
jgi:hypothetical protein